MPTVNIPYDLNRQIKALADREKRPVSAIIADAVALYREANKHHLNVDLRKLAFIFDTAGDETRNYLDLHTGKILTLLATASNQAEINQIEAQLHDRYVRIPGADPNAGMTVLREFLATVTNKRLHDLLEVAMTGRGAHTRFRNVLSSHPSELQRWHEFKEHRLKERILRWMDEHYIALEE